MEVVRGPAADPEPEVRVPLRAAEPGANALGPLDRLPGLQVGQRWDTRVVNPLTGRSRRCGSRSQRRTLIHWNGEPVTPSRSSSTPPMTARTWVRPDGLVLRQEVPFPFVRLVLERRPDAGRRGLETEGAGPMIELRGVTKVFGTKRAVDRLDLTVRAGELFAFLGPNGAGKTTTIKMVCGLLAPTARHRPGRRASRGPPGGPAAPGLRPRPAVPLREADRPRVPPVRRRDVRPRPAAGRRRIDELIETFEMADYVDELCENYSQGMKQRVVFASALVHDPKVLIVDEPLVGLDPAVRRIVKDLFVVAGAVGGRGADVDPPAVDRRGAGRHDRDRRPRPDARRGHAGRAPRAGPARTGRSRTCS